MLLPDNPGERRESLKIFEKVGLAQGLLDSIATDGEVSRSGPNFTSDWDHRRPQRYRASTKIVIIIRLN